MNYLDVLRQRYQKAKEEKELMDKENITRLITVTQFLDELQLKRDVIYKLTSERRQGPNFFAVWDTEARGFCFHKDGERMIESLPPKVFDNFFKDELDDFVGEAIEQKLEEYLHKP